MISKEESKAKIIESFLKNVVGRFPESDDLIKKHKGKKGHWLESNLGGKIDADGNADLDGFECKIESKKISWGDWGPPYRIFCDKSYDLFRKGNAYKNMWKFVEALGVKRNDLEKGIYHSMSGEHVPTYINDSTNIGLSLEEKNSDISIKYNFDKDLRDSKGLNVPKEFQKNNLLIYRWYGSDSSFKTFRENIIENNLPIKVQFEGKNAAVSLEERIRRKFGVYGIVVGLYDQNKGFYGLKFLKKIVLDDWLGFFKNKDVFYDTGLTTRNKRQYNQWRSNAKFMKTLEEDIYIPKNF